MQIRLCLYFDLFKNALVFIYFYCFSFIHTFVYFLFTKFTFIILLSVYLFTFLVYLCFWVECRVLFVCFVWVCLFVYLLAVDYLTMSDNKCFSFSRQCSFRFVALSSCNSWWPISLGRYGQQHRRHTSSCTLPWAVQFRPHRQHNFFLPPFTFPLLSSPTPFWPKNGGKKLLPHNEPWNDTENHFHFVVSTQQSSQ